MAASLLTSSLLAVLIVLQLSSTSGAESVRTKRATTEKRKVRVVSLPHVPYTIEAKDGIPGVYNSSGKGYYGFIPDLLQELSYRLNLEIDFYIEPTGRFGYYDKKNGSWVGMVGEVIKREKNIPNEGADIAAAALTLTSSREKVVNFIKGFQHHGLTMLVKKPAQKAPKNIWESSFDVVRPLSAEVWACCTIGVIVVGLLLWANNRFNPYEWGGRYDIGRASEAAAESFNLPGSLWFAFTSLQWQGFDRAPRSIASKTLTCFWFVFVTLTLVTYTGSLVNHLFWASTVHGSSIRLPPVNSLRQLVKQSEIDYGYVNGGSTHKYFTETASGAIFDEMRNYWKARGPSIHVTTTEEGVRRVRDSNYVFLMEKYSAEYYANTKPCDLMTVGDLIGHRSYGFAVPHNMDHQLSEDLHAAILEMMEEGDIEALEKKWWYAKGDCGAIKTLDMVLEEQSALYINKPKVVSMNMFWGPVVLLTVGVILTILIAIAEVMFYKYKGRYQRQNRPGDAKLQLDDDAVN